MPGLLADDELAAIRATAESSFDLTVRVTRASVAASAGGSITAGTPVVIDAALPARLATPTGPLLGIWAARVGAQQVFILTVAVGADVKVGDHIGLGSDTLYVHSALNPNSYASADRYVCAEVN